MNPASPFSGNYADAFLPANLGSADSSYNELLAVNGLVIPLGAANLISISIPRIMKNRRIYKYTAVVPSNAADFGIFWRWKFYLNNSVVCELTEAYSSSTGATPSVKRSAPVLCTADWEPSQHARSDIRLCLCGPLSAGAGEQSPVVLHPFPVNVEADRLSISIEAAINVSSIYRVWIGCISDQGFTS